MTYFVESSSSRTSRLNPNYVPETTAHGYTIFLAVLGFFEGVGTVRKLVEVASCLSGHVQDVFRGDTKHLDYLVHLIHLHREER